MNEMQNTTQNEMQTRNTWSLRYGLIFLMVVAARIVVGQQIESPTAKGYKTTVAIVIDAPTYQKVKDEVGLYKQSLETRGIGAYVVSHAWTKPEEVRSVLKDLYNKKPRLEGAVLVGDIPIAMVRDAQHLTSTFKMDQRIDWKRSSVPSDRYYDDFDLEFNFLKQDTLRKNYFYYSLSASSPQKITMDIYTSRIKPSVTAGQDAIAVLRTYLRKITAVGQEQNKFDNLMVYTGYGYNSESLNAWSGEQIALREQFPALFRPGGAARFMNFRMEPYMKFSLLGEIQRPDLDLAMFHGHGDEETQLINGYPLASNPNPSIDNIRRYLRSKVQVAHRKKQDVAALKLRFAESLGVPESWMNDALVDSVMRADSIFEVNTNISIADVRGITPNARMIVLDHCDNGEFHQDSYIAGQYAFGSGKTMVVLANSVGVLQDQWPGEMLGLLQHGVRVGNWFKQVAYLETHLFGDATYAFTTGGDLDLNSMIVNEPARAATWHKLRVNSDPDLQALALARLAAINGPAASVMLKEAYFSAPGGTTRMEALKQLNLLDNAEYIAVLKAAVDDPYELVQRLAVCMIGDKGTDELIPTLVHAAIANRYSKRVAYRIKGALSFMDSDQVIAEIDRQLPQFPNLVDRDALRKELVDAQVASRRKVTEDFVGIATLPAKERAFNIRSLRVYTYHQAVPQVLAFIRDDKAEAKVRTDALEALSWFTHSYQRPQIVALCQQLIDNPSSTPAVREQALKTRKILAEGQGR